MTSDTPLQIGMLLYPDMTFLDLAGPFEIFSHIPHAKVHLIWKDRNPIISDVGMTVIPSTTFSECPPLDVLCVPGGPGQIALMDDSDVLDFIRKMGATAKYVTSVCTGSLLLAAAGLLTGYRAACHWMSRDQLSLLGAMPVAERIVKDRNRITGGGVTAGIDFGFFVAGVLCGEERAKDIQLRLEYDPKPPFPGGTDSTADPALVAAVRESSKDMLTKRLAATKRAAERLR
ncbi:MAG: DJ-1/PfpI family protein [Chthoniobacterales bacterium]